MADWRIIVPYIFMGLFALYIVFQNIRRNKKRLTKDISKLKNGKVNEEDFFALFDLMLFVMECAAQLGGISNVRGLLEELVKGCQSE